MKTVKINAAEIKKDWVHVDADGQVLGRLASQIAHVLRGKHKPSFVPYWDSGDYVVVTNAAKIKLTGRKLDKKLYQHHSTYIGGLKTTNAKDLLAKHPERVLIQAVKRMLPKNKLADVFMKNLKVYPEAEHKQQAQKPVPMAPRTAV